jgi:hypothetical protein
MAIEALKRIFQIPALKKQKEVAPAQDQKKRKPPKKEQKGARGKIDIKI